MLNKRGKRKISIVRSLASPLEQHVMRFEVSVRNPRNFPRKSAPIYIKENAVHNIWVTIYADPARRLAPTTPGNPNTFWLSALRQSIDPRDRMIAMVIGLQTMIKITPQQPARNATTYTKRARGIFHNPKMKNRTRNEQGQYAQQAQDGVISNCDPKQSPGVV